MTHTLSREFQGNKNCGQLLNRSIFIIPYSKIGMRAAQDQVLDGEGQTVGKGKKKNRFVSLDLGDGCPSAVIHSQPFITRTTSTISHERRCVKAVARWSVKQSILSYQMTFSLSQKASVCQMSMQALLWRAKTRLSPPPYPVEPPSREGAAR